MPVCVDNAVSIPFEVSATQGTCCSDTAIWSLLDPIVILVTAEKGDHCHWNDNHQGEQGEGERRRLQGVQSAVLVTGRIDRGPCQSKPNVSAPLFLQTGMSL